MAKKNENTDRELNFRRLVNAPRALVFEVWTDPKHIIKWWGPNGFTNTIHAMDVRIGGKWSFIIHGPDGTDYPNCIVYQEVVKPSKLVFLHGADENDPNAFHVTVMFDEEAGKTLIQMRVVFVSKADKDFKVDVVGAIEGNRQTMDKLEAYLDQYQAAVK
jgi:uncharacterized protein YndB with AHSA1/START domain